MPRNRKFESLRSAQQGAEGQSCEQGRRDIAEPDAPVDPEVLAELRASLDDDEFIASVVADFCEKSPNFIAQMRAAVRSGDRQSWVLAAHTLKGQSGTVGAARVRSLCQVLEDLAWPPDPTSAERMLTRLEEELRDAGAGLAVDRN